VEGIAHVLPVEVIADLLGLPRPCGRCCAADRRRSWPCTSRIREGERRRGPERAAADFVAALRDLVAPRRRRPRDDLVSDLGAAELQADELVGTAALLLMAGHRGHGAGQGESGSVRFTARAAWGAVADK
jgi:unspecific monooxygenase